MVVTPPLNWHFPEGGWCGLPPEAMTCGAKFGTTYLLEAFVRGDLES